MMPRQLLKQAVLCLLVLVVLCVSIAAAQPDDHLSRKLIRIVPPGWELMQPVKQFGPKNLWEQIDGRAEFFLSYGMTQMTFAVFTHPSDAETFIDVSIYHMENPTGAFGVFSAERPKENDPLHLGRRGYRSGGSLFIWKGLFYIRMIASSDNLQLQKINGNLAEQLTSIIHDSGASVWGLDILPKADRITDSERYFRQDAMGLDFMQNTFTARYQKNDVLITLFILSKKNPAAAADVLSRYMEYAKQLGEGYKKVPQDGVVIILCDMGGSYDAFFQKDQIVAGVTEIEDPRLAVDSTYELWRHLNGK